MLKEAVNKNLIPKKYYKTCLHTINFIIECQIDNNMLFKGRVYERKIVIDSLACYDEHFAIMM